MTAEINLRDLFDAKLRAKTYSLLASALGNMDFKLVVKFADEALAVTRPNVDTYLSQNEVNLFNMESSTDAILKQIIIPYLNKKRVR